MALPEVVTREEWLEARKKLLTAEKAATRSRDALNAERRRLPMVRVDKEYRLDGPDGEVTLAGLFGDSQLDSRTDDRQTAHVGGGSVPTDGI